MRVILSIFAVFTAIMFRSASSIMIPRRSLLSKTSRQLSYIPRAVAASHQLAKESFTTSSSTSSTWHFASMAVIASSAAFIADQSQPRSNSRLFSSSLASCAGAEGIGLDDKWSQTRLYPKTPMLEKGSVKVSDVHTVSYTVWGNPKGKPVLFVHGGPGGGTTPDMARFFDPKAYKIVLVDQRGCGDSIPFANLQDNTTWDSVRDFEKIRTLLGIEKWQVFGGSWGSTLALSYAMTHPNRVTELVLRGIFLIRKKELDWLYQGPGANYVFPEDWKAYEEAIPPAERGDYMTAYGKRLRGELGEEEMRKAAKAWSIWEGRTSKLVQDPWETVMGHFGADDFSLAFARIENHYFTNKGFFERDGWLLEKQNIDKIRHIPTVIVQGRYDMVCPAISAHDLKQVFPEAELHYTLTGHSGFEKEIIEKLVDATDRFKNR